MLGRGWAAHLRMPLDRIGWSHEVIAMLCEPDNIRQFGRSRSLRACCLRQTESMVSRNLHNS